MTDPATTPEPGRPAKAKPLLHAVKSLDIQSDRQHRNPGTDLRA